jgi:hypothetical protein
VESRLLSESVSVESEDALLPFILKLGSDDRNLLRYIQIGFLPKDVLFLFNEHFWISPESVWWCAFERIAHSASPNVDSDLFPASEVAFFVSSESLLAS